MSLPSRVCTNTKRSVVAAAGNVNLGPVVPVKIFSKLSCFIFGYFDPTNIFLDKEKKLLSG